MQKIPIRYKRQDYVLHLSDDGRFQRVTPPAPYEFWDARNCMRRTSYWTLIDRVNAYVEQLQAGK